MNSGELAHTTAIPETSRPAPPASFTDLQTIQTETPHHDNCDQGAASNTNALNPEHDMESFSYTGHHQLNAGDQGQYVSLPVGGLHPSLHDHPYASLDTASFDDAAVMDGVLEQQSFLTKLAEETFSSGSDSNFSTSSTPSSPPSPHQHQHNILGVRKETKHSQKKQVYTKKPLNAFTLFMQDMRPTVGPTIKRRGNSAVTAHLGSVWKSLSSKEQEKYVKEAEHQRFLHQQQHPDCSANENSGKILAKAKKQRLQRNRDEGKSSESESKESPPSKQIMLKPKYRKQSSEKDGTEIRWDMKLRSGKRPNYQE